MQNSYFTDEELEKLSNYLFENAEKLVYEERTTTRPAYPNRKDLEGYTWLVVNVEGLGEIRYYLTSVSEELAVSQRSTDNFITKEQIKKYNFDKAFSEIKKFRSKKGLEEGINEKENFFKNL